MNKFVEIIKNGDIGFLIHQKCSLHFGKLTTNICQILYGERLKIESSFKIWGKIRFLILGGGSISIGSNFHAVSSRKRSVITLFSPCHISVLGDAVIKIGDNVSLNGTTITSRNYVFIGDNTQIGPNTIIIDNDGHPIWPPEDRWTKKGPSAPIIIQNNVWIGMNCIILKGVTIGYNSVIAAGSIVIKDVEPNSLYAGNPAKKIKSLLQ